ncbi:MAG: NAD(P)H-dependent oxidoreductase subunit E [Clostridiaceae bacterium]
MKNLNVEVCACTECVMNGSMDIMEAIEQLKETSHELKGQYHTDIEINITPVKCLGEEKHGISSPRVSINDSIFEKTNSETIMAEIISAMKMDVIL